MTENQSALARDTIEQLAGVFHDPAEINARLALGAEANLIAPGPQVGTLAGGCGVAISVLYFNPFVNDAGHGPDVYAVGDGLALRKHAIDRIGTTFGVSWDPVQSSRSDDRRTLHYWAYRAVGVYRHYDGTPATLSDEYDVDARDKGERVQELWDTPRRRGESTEDWQERVGLLLRKVRKYGLAMAASGARLRAMTQVGLKRAYSPAELCHPFVVARLHFDGWSDDEAERELYAVETARAFLGGLQALYGPRPSAVICGAKTADRPNDQCVGERGHGGRHQDIWGRAWG